MSHEFESEQREEIEMIAALGAQHADEAAAEQDEPITSRTFHYVRPLDPAYDAAWNARAQVRFAENRALADAISARRIAIIREGGDPDAAPQQLPMAA
jgi:hypothetical protein